MPFKDRAGILLFTVILSVASVVTLAAWGGIAGMMLACRGQSWGRLTPLHGSGGGFICPRHGTDDFASLPVDFASKMAPKARIAARHFRDPP